MTGRLGVTSQAKTSAFEKVNLPMSAFAVEVARLRLSSIDWERPSFAVPADKGGRGRLLRLPQPVTSALRDYVRIRPRTDHEFLFGVIGTLAGLAVTTTTISGAMWRACQRCRSKRAGTHRRRHAFAIRLMCHGANLNPIATAVAGAAYRRLILG